MSGPLYDRVLPDIQRRQHRHAPEEAVSFRKEKSVYGHAEGDRRYYWMLRPFPHASICDLPVWQLVIVSFIVIENAERRAGTDRYSRILQVVRIRIVGVEYPPAWGWWGEIIIGSQSWITIVQIV